MQRLKEMMDATTSCCPDQREKRQQFLTRPQQLKPQPYPDTTVVPSLFLAAATTRVEVAAPIWAPRPPRGVPQAPWAAPPLRPWAVTATGREGPSQTTTTATTPAWKRLRLRRTAHGGEGDETAAAGQVANDAAVPDQGFGGLVAGGGGGGGMGGVGDFGGGGASAAASGGGVVEGDNNAWDAVDGGGIGSLGGFGVGGPGIGSATGANVSMGERFSFIQGLLAAT